MKVYFITTIKMFFFTYFQRLYENKCVFCVKGCSTTYYDCTIACDSHDK